MVGFSIREGSCKDYNKTFGSHRYSYYPRCYRIRIGLLPQLRTGVTVKGFIEYWGTNNAPEVEVN